MEAYKGDFYEAYTDYRKFLVSDFGSKTLHKLVLTNETFQMREYLIKNKALVDEVEPESGVTPLITACNEGYLSAVKLLVKWGADINCRCSGINNRGQKYTVTPIYVAAEANHESIVDFLGRRGAEVNFQCEPQGFTPLFIAVNRGFEGVASILVEDLKANVNIPSKQTDLNYPLTVAVMKTDHEILSILLSAEGVDPNVADDNMRVTALHAASYKGDLVAVEMLVANGAHVNVELVTGHTPLDLAIQQRRINEEHQALIDFLKSNGGETKMVDKSWMPFSFALENWLSLKEAINDGANPNARLPKGHTLIHSYILKRDTTPIKFLLRKGANINGTDFYGNTPLHFAAEFGFHKVVDFLLKNGAFIDAQSHCGATPLHRAVQENHHATCQLLLSNGANFNAYMHETGPPIFLAAHRGYQTRVVKMFLDAGFDPNAKFRVDSNEESTALHLACFNAAECPETIRALVQAGADVNSRQKSPFGFLYPLHCLPMNSSKYSKAMIILMEAGAFIDADCFPLMDAILPPRGGGNDVFSLMIKQSNDRKAAFLYENTVKLFEAVRRNDLNGVRTCAAKGGIVNCCSVKYDTPLVYASWKGHLDIVKFLLANGAKVHLPHLKKSSPLHYAAKFNRKDVAVQLIKVGAPIDLICCGKTSLELAQEKNHTEMVSLLRLVEKWLVASGKKKVCPVVNYNTDPIIVQVLKDCGGTISDKHLRDLFA